MTLSTQMHEPGDHPGSRAAGRKRALASAVSEEECIAKNESVKRSLPLARAAEDLARRGRVVFPLKAGTKGGQLLESWTREASNDVERVRQWWKRWPDANIGIACGPSGLLAVDVDGEIGASTWADIESKYDIQRSPMVSRSGGGGAHILYRVPDGVRIGNSQKLLGPGVDTRADGGYIVAPPSIHPNGQAYAWSDPNAEPAPCPPQLIELLTREPDQWDIQTLADAFAPRAPLRWLVHGVLPAESLVITYGAPGALKSMLLADLAVCVSSGEHWLAPLPGQDASAFSVTEPAPVLWLDVDNGARRTADRFEALARAHKVKLSAPLNYVSMPNPPFVAGDPESVRMMAARINANGYRLVVIDNLSAIKGQADENSDAMAPVMASLRQLTEATGAAIIVIHHQRKGQPRGGDGQARDGESLRGHSSIEASIDLALLVMRENGTQNVLVKSTKDRDVPVAQFAATFTFEHDATGRLNTAKMQQIAAVGRSEAREAEQVAKLEGRVLQILSEKGPLATKAIEDSVKGQRRDALRQVLANLQLSGRISITEGAHGAKIHSIRSL